MPEFPILHFDIHMNLPNGEIYRLSSIGESIRNDMLLFVEDDKQYGRFTPVDRNDEYVFIALVDNQANIVDNIVYRVEIDREVYIRVRPNERRHTMINTTLTLLTEDEDSKEIAPIAEV